LFEIAASVAGVGLLAGAFVWRAATLRHRARRLDAELANSDPQVRRAGLESIGEQWLGPHAGVLLELAGRETDPEVIAAMIMVVSRHQWEPASPPLIELRKRVQQWLDDSPRAHEPSSAVAQVEFEPAAFLSWLTAILGEPVRELRIHQAHGSAVLRPLLPSPPDESAAAGDGKTP